MSRVSLYDSPEQNPFTEENNLQHDTYETRERGHGREEYRCYTVLHHTSGLGNAADWAGLTTIGSCYTERTVAGQTSNELRYFIGSTLILGNAEHNHGRFPVG